MIDMVEHAYFYGNSLDWVDSGLCASQELRQALRHAGKRLQEKELELQTIHWQIYVNDVVFTTLFFFQVNWGPEIHNYSFRECFIDSEGCHKLLVMPQLLSTL